MLLNKTVTKNATEKEVVMQKQIITKYIQQYRLVGKNLVRNQKVDENFFHA